ncbi:MAG: hypothetical protein RIT37_1816 [Bacteroidota bacterium]
MLTLSSPDMISRLRDQDMKQSHFGPISAMSIVIANMIGTGVFTSLGYQLLTIQDFAAIISLWVIGGLLSLCGAFVYAELGALFPHSGGEYRYLSDVFHPSIGFLSGWTSSTIGFTAPLAMSAIAVGNYVVASIGFGHPMIIGLLALLSLTAIHTMSHKASGTFQSFSTGAKVLFVILLILLGFSHAEWNFEHFAPTISTAQQMTSPSFAVSLIYVIFAYSGWNASAYVASELKNPERDVPLSIILGTVFVTIVYVLINMMFLMVAPINDLTVNSETMMPKELVVIAGSHFLPPLFATISGLIIAFMLISSMSAMIVAGPRVLRSMVNEYVPSQKGKDISTIPVKSIWIQTGIAVLMILTSTYDTLITFTTFLITLFSSLTALAAIYARFSMRSVHRPYRMFAYPTTPVLFLLINLWIMQKTIQDKPTDMYYVAGILLSGVIAFIFFSRKRQVIE